MSAVVDVKYKAAPIDHIVVKLSLTEARDFVAAYKAAHDMNRYFFDIWGRLPEVVSDVTKTLGDQHRENRRIRKHPDGGFGVLSDEFIGMTFATNMKADSNVGSQP